jgi:hypothetical protein
LRKELSAIEFNLAPVFPSPNDKQTPIGNILAIPRVTDGEAVHMVLVLRRHNETTVDWITERWDVLLRTYVRYGRGDGWTRLPDHVSRNAWVKVGFDSGGLDGFVEPFEGLLVRIRAGIRAIDARSRREVRLPTGPAHLNPEEGEYYVVERVTADGWVYFRREVGADFDCGDPEAEKHVVTEATPRYRIRLDSLFDKGGRPLLTPSHPMGC